MKISRRNFLSLLGAGTVAAGIAGCEWEHPEEPLTVWLIWPKDPGMPITSLLERLAAARPELIVESGSISSSNIREKLITAAQQHTLPDIFLISSAWLQDLGGGNNLQDLAPLAAADGLNPADLLIAHDYQRCQSGGKLLCLPAVSSRGTSMLFLNRALLDRFGLTEAPRFANWAEFTDVSRQWVAKTNRPDNLEYISLDPFMGPVMARKPAPS